MDGAAGAQVRRQGPCKKRRWLPSGIASNFVEQGNAGGRSAQGFVVHHFHSFVTGASGKAAGGCEEMGALPDSPCAKNTAPGHSDRARQ